MQTIEQSIGVRSEGATYAYNRTHNLDLPESAVQVRPINGLSPRYTYVSTSRLVDGLRDVGWSVVRSQQARVRIPDRVGFQKHAVWFRQTQLMAQMPEGYVPELVLVNAHDGTSSYQLHMGVFRVQCRNGLVVGDTDFQALRFPHRGSSTEKVVEASLRLVDAIPSLIARVGQMKSRMMETSERRGLAEQALALRYPTNPPTTPDGLLAVRRCEDEGRTLWETLNVVQENLLRGGTITSAGLKTERGHLRSVRPCRGIGTSVRLNRQLWEVAATYLN